MDLVSVILESMDLDPIKSLENADPYQMFSEDGNAFLEEALEEAGKGANKKNVLQKIWDFIKKVCKWISKQISRFISFIKGFFKRKSKTADQIADEVVPSNRKKAFAAGALAAGAIAVGAAGAAANGKGASSPPVPSSSVSPQSVSVQSVSSEPVPSNPSSTVQPPSMDEIIKPLICAFDHDKNSVKFSYRDIIKNGQGVKVKGKGIVRESDITEVYTIINNPELMTEFLACLDIIKTRELNNNNFHDKYQSFNNKYRTAHGEVRNMSQSDFSINLDQLDRFNKQFIEINKILEIIDLPEMIDQKGMNMVFTARPYDSGNIVNDINEIAGLVARWQMGINAVMGALQSVYQIDKQFNDSIDDIETLSQFVQKSFEAGIPGKYIMWNGYKISSTKLKGNGKNGSETSPIWGQSRFVFFPDGDKSIVHKIAYNPWGLRANKSEMMITNKVKESGETEDIIAKVTAHASNDYVINIERADNQDVPGFSIIAEVKGKLREFCRKLNLPISLGDIHQGNVRKIRGNWVAIDYGDVERSWQ